MYKNEGLDLGHTMANVAADNADIQHDFWRAQAYMMFIAHAKKNRFFTTEDVRNENPDMPEPPDNRAWGAVALQAKKDNCIRAQGFVRSKNLSVHGSIVTHWMSLIYRGADESNNN